MAVIASPITLYDAHRYLKLCGYSEALLRADFQFGENRTVPLAAFAHEPTDARSACIAAILPSAEDVLPQVVACRDLGAPIVVAVLPKTVQVWKQRARAAELVEQIPAAKAEAFFRSRKAELSPEAVFRAKTWGRLDRQFQLSFVDAGLMPLVEQEIGKRLTGLIERVVHAVRRSLWPKPSEVSVENGHWLLKSVFWILAAKILHDKKVDGFINLDLAQVDDVFARVARHYDSRNAASPGVLLGTHKQRDALAAAAADIANFSHLGNVTTESLAQVYESALISKDTRAALGTHSTPQYLVDYIVWKLAPWIRELPEDKRDVFEPASGHAAFLVAAMRLLKEELSAEKQADRRLYLRKHLHGVEVDSFAVEIARLSLTLADIPNPNGWDLVCDDMFTKSILQTKAQRASILLGNPPFEDFSQLDRQAHARNGTTADHVNKTAEVLCQVLPQLRNGGVFGFVVPQGFLHSKNAGDVRSLICRDFEIQEICLFPDKVFSFSDAESAVIIGRRSTSSTSGCSVSFRRVREQDMPRFALDFCVTTKVAVPQGRLCQSPGHVLRLPDLIEIWDALRNCPRLAELAELGQGLAYQGQDRLSEGALTVSDRPFRGSVSGFAHFGGSTAIHGLPTEVFMSLDSLLLLRRRTGTATGVQQVLLNYAPVGRGPWRLKALIDRSGHAVTSRFTTVRPISRQTPLEYLWAVLNNPMANAFVYAYSMKRDVLVGLMREMPIPRASSQDMEQVAELAADYLIAAADTKGESRSRSEDLLKQRLLRVDSAVLRLYDLPPKSERQLLDLFAGHQRGGVPFSFDRYFPKDFTPWLHLHEYLSEGFTNSSAKAMLNSHQEFETPEVSEALRRATEDFEE